MDDFIEILLQNLDGDYSFRDYVIYRAFLRTEGMGYNILHAVSFFREDNAETVQRLLQRYNNVNETTSSFKHTPLHYAVANRKRNAVAAFIDAGAFVNCQDFCGRTPLHFAIDVIWQYIPNPDRNIECDMWIVEKLLCHPEIEVNIVDSSGCTPLMRAVKNRNSSAVNALLKKGANPNIANLKKQTPLHKALSLENPCLNILSALLENGAGIYCKDKSGQTPIDILVQNVPDSETLQLAEHVVWMIALRYHVRESLRRRLKEIPILCEYLEKCCSEVRLMKKQILFDKLNLHDFALNCFHVPDLFAPVIQLLLLFGSYEEYFEYIMLRF